MVGRVFKSQTKYIFALNNLHKYQFTQQVIRMRNKTLGKTLEKYDMHMNRFYFDRQEHHLVRVQFRVCKIKTMHGCWSRRQFNNVCAILVSIRIRNTYGCIYIDAFAERRIYYLFNIQSMCLCMRNRSSETSEWVMYETHCRAKNIGFPSKWWNQFIRNICM